MSSLLLVGAGPGIGASIARHCVQDGESVGLIARTRVSTDPITKELIGRGCEVAVQNADAADESQLRKALDAIVDSVGVPRLVVYNVGLIRADRPGELTYAELQHTWSVNVLGALATATQLSPHMAAAGGGTIVVTGGMPTPVPSLTSLSLGKAGVRALTALLAEELKPARIHVATVTVGGAVAPGSAYDPDEIAAVYRRLHNQPPEAWEHEITYLGAPSGAGNTA